jgi:hypothetical protein
VFDGERAVGRIYRINAATELCWWGVSFMLTGRKGYGIAETREEAMAAFEVEYEHWLQERGS